MITVKRSIADIVIASKNSTIIIIKRYMAVATENGTETTIINFETGLDREFFRHERFIEKPVSPYR
jgi:hypothetical protein